MHAQRFGEKSATLVARIGSVELMPTVVECSELSQEDHDYGIMFSNCFVPTIELS